MITTPSRLNGIPEGGISDLLNMMACARSAFPLSAASSMLARTTACFSSSMASAFEFIAERHWNCHEAALLLDGFLSHCSLLSRAMLSLQDLEDRMMKASDRPVWLLLPQLSGYLWGSLLLYAQQLLVNRQR
mmetsp:Transcript_24186/g.44058  ORF Transcript_24186/g.44058 Transcript_24186/m.44058 type:complete len:132 (+) Transcript_24186:576-971(+)